jgi:hypothetical protein
MHLWFVETHTFSRRVERLGLEQELRRLQETLLAHPEAGDIDPGTGGLRKVRMGDPARGRGKRGGARVHYLWLPTHGVVYLLYLYSKNEQMTLEPAQKKQLRAITGLIKAEWA